MCRLRNIAMSVTDGQTDGGQSDPQATQIYKKRLLPICIHHFKSDLINNMDHMRIPGTEPSSVVLSQRINFKS